MSRGFRVWDNQAKSYDWDREFVLSPNGNLMELCSNHNGTWDYHFADEGRFIVEQNTGFKDKNGREIYEGDIVNVIGIGIAQVIDSPTGEWMLYYMREPDEINNGFVSVIPKNKPSGLWKTNTTSYIEVIGNIHENPELLGVENE